MYSATITVTAGATACKDATITVRDKRGNSQTVSVHILCSQAFTFTAPGGVQNFTVPSGVTQVTVDAVGASGGSACFGGIYHNAGGLGFELKATGIAVTPGQTLYVYVGGSPVGNATFPNDCQGKPTFFAGGFNGGGAGFSVGGGNGSSGGGGGASDLRTGQTDLTTRLIVAGGGGGGAGFGTTATGGNGGYANGATGGYSFVGPDPTSTLAGQGGTQNAGGAGGQAPTFSGVAFPCNGDQGSLGMGSQASCGTGAGGGGYYGGGSGAAYTSNDSSGNQGTSGGGGGSSFVVNGATVVTQQLATDKQCDANNNGCITISY